MGIQFTANCDNCDKDFDELFETKEQLVKGLEQAEWVFDEQLVMCSDCVDEQNEDEDDEEEDD